MSRVGTALITILISVLALKGCSDEKTAPVYLVDLDGNPVDAIDESDSDVTVFLFTRIDCPISNRYAPIVRSMCNEFAPRRVQFVLVYPDRMTTTEQIREHVQAFDYPCVALRDPEHALVQRTGATVTPEAAVFVGWESMPYRGRIDDWYVDFGKSRAMAGQHDLNDALHNILAGRPVSPATTQAVGCYISDLK